jgi:hypothetical protein
MAIVWGEDRRKPAISASNSLGLTNVVGTGPLFHKTYEDSTKSLPLICTRNPSPWTMALTGETEAIEGTGLRTSSETEFKYPGITTTPAPVSKLGKLERALAGTVTWRVLLLTNVVADTGKVAMTCEPGTNPEPDTVSVNSSLLGLALLGEMESIH